MDRRYRSYTGSLTMLADIAVRFTYWSRRWVPGSFVIACGLTAITFLAGTFLTPSSLLQCLRYWGDGFWTLLSFAMQMCLIMVTGYVVAVSPAVKRLLEQVAALPRSGTGAVAAMAVASMALGWINWGLGLVASAMLVRVLARRNLPVDYRVLVAVAYFGMGTTWHAGLSASAPLLVATPGHFMEKQIGIIPLSETVFSPFNLGLTLCVFLVMTLVAVSLHPAPSKRVPPPSGPGQESLPAALGRGTEPSDDGSAPPESFADRLDGSYPVNLVVGLAGAAWW
ncbi:MAG: short-chain fatty acid transporter, partial [Acidobacteria bacterium]|nr:short-chain fatty acid transporter [Acidobacteriota bacterium]